MEPEMMDGKQMKIMMRKMMEEMMEEMMEKMMSEKMGMSRMKDKKGMLEKALSY